MPRQMKLIYKLLEYVEQNALGGEVSVPEFNEYSRDEVQYHIRLCVEAGYLEADLLHYMGQKVFVVLKCLTWAGQEELARIRREGVESSS